MLIASSAAVRALPSNAGAGAGETINSNGYGDITVGKTAENAASFIRLMHIGECGRIANRGNRRTLLGLLVLTFTKRTPKLRPTLGAMSPGRTDIFRTLAEWRVSHGSSFRPERNPLQMYHDLSFRITKRDLSRKQKKKGPEFELLLSRGSFAHT